MIVALVYKCSPNVITDPKVQANEAVNFFISGCQTRRKHTQQASDCVASEKCRFGNNRRGAFQRRCIMLKVHSASMAGDSLCQPRHSRPIGFLKLPAL